MNRFVLIVIFFFVSCKDKAIKVDQDYKSLDSISQSIDGSYYYSAAVKISLQKYKTILEQKNKDSTYRIYLRKLSNHYYNFGIWQDYIATCRKNLKLSIISKDSVLIARYYRDIGDYHFQFATNDSSYLYYTRAVKWLKTTKQEEKIGQVILSMAKLQLYENNFAESEIQAVKALKLAKNFNDKRLIFDCYNVLGLVFYELNDFEKAIYYYGMALDQLNRSKDEFDSNDLFAQTYNNIGIVYQKSEQHTKAIESFVKGLNTPNLKKINLLSYAILLDNLTYSRFRNHDLVEEKDFLVPLKIRDSLSNKLGVIISYTRLGEFNLSKRDTTHALDYFNKGLELSKEVKSYRDEMVLLDFLSLCEPTNRVAYKNEIISLKDKLLNKERLIRNKFIRIEYETDELIFEKEKISRQRTLIAIFSTILIVFLSLLYIIYRQKSNHKILLLNQMQQKSNEEIFNLMIDQQNKIEEGRNSERSRISKELHDGIQSRLLGIRLNLSILKVKHDKATIENSIKYLEQLKELEREVRDISHDLNRDIYFNKESFLLLIENLVKETSNDSIEISLKVDNDIIWSEINNVFKINVYRIIQEGLQNIIKHSKANKASVFADLFEGKFRLRIIDNGIGVDVTKIKKGIGLSNITDRVKLLNGTFELKSKTNNGTELIIIIPTNEQN